MRKLAYELNVGDVVGGHEIVDIPMFSPIVVAVYDDNTRQTFHMDEWVEVEKAEADDE